MKLSKKIAVLISTCIVLSLLPRPAYACSCGAPGPSPLESLEVAVAVFAGEVVSVDVPESVDGIISSADPVKYTFQVQTVWKGPVEPALTVTTARMDSSCGYAFEMGQSYLVYASGHETSLRTDICTRTQPLAAAAEDLSALGDGEVPPAPRWDLVPMAAALLIVVVSATAASAILHHRRKSLS